MEVDKQPDGCILPPFIVSVPTQRSESKYFSNSKHNWKALEDDPDEQDISLQEWKLMPSSQVVAFVNYKPATSQHIPRTAQCAAAKMNVYKKQEQRHRQAEASEASDPEDWSPLVAAAEKAPS